VGLAHEIQPMITRTLIKERQTAYGRSIAVRYSCSLQFLDVAVAVISLVNLSKLLSVDTIFELVPICLSCLSLIAVL
jgi:hypothetical protein